MQKHDNEWITPAWLVELARSVATKKRIELDPFPAAGSHVRPRFKMKNGLGRRRWVDKAAGGLVWVNPPYSRDLLGECIARTIEEAAAGAHILLLCPSSTDTRWFHDLYPVVDQICFLKGRVRFEGRAKFGPLFPSMVAHFSAADVEIRRSDFRRADRLRNFRRVFGERGLVLGC